MSRINL